MKVLASAEAEKTKMLANAEAEKIKMLANAEAEKTLVTGNAEAEKTLALGKSNAESYRLQVEAMGGEQFTRLKVAEIIGREKIKVIPDILISGNNGNGEGGSLQGLLGLRLMDELSKREEK